MVTQTTSRLDAALDYIERGFALLPVGQDKRPHWGLLPEDKDGKPTWKPLASSPVGRKEVEQWFCLDPDCNIGIITGEPSGGVTIVDFDRKPPARLFMPPTPRVITARQFHCYFHSSSPIRGRKLPWGEVKSDGGYCLLPPSRHPSGHIYRWEDLLSLDDVDLAECPDWVLGQPHQKSITSVVSREYSLLTTPPDLGLKGAALGAWDADDDFVLAACGVLGIPLRSADDIGKPFCCVLPRHAEQHPSASLFRRSDGLVVYRDWHKASGHEWFYLAEVRASLAYGRAVRLSPPAMATWHLRLIVEAGFAEPARIDLPPLPEKASNPVIRVYDGLRLLLGCKWLYEYGAPTAFSWSFAAVWCGVTERQAGSAIKELVRLGIIEVVERRPLMLYAPGKATQ